MTRNDNPPLRLRLDPGLQAELVALAAALGRSPAWVIEQAVRACLASEAAQIGAIRAGIAAADAGDLAPHGEVAAWVASWGTEAAKPAP